MHGALATLSAAMDECPPWSSFSESDRVVPRLALERLVMLRIMPFVMTPHRDTAQYVAVFVCPSHRQLPWLWLTQRTCFS